MSEQKQEPNIREYNFAVGGNIQRHIPGIPGEWPFGSRVSIDEDTNQVVAVWPEGAEPVIPMPVEEEKSGSDTPSEPDKSVDSEQVSSQTSADSGQANPVPPAQSEQPTQLAG